MVTSTIEPLYPAAPPGVPADIAAPSRAYRIRALLTLGGLIAFFACYFALGIWFAWVAYHMFFQVYAAGAGRGSALLAGAVGAILAFFTLRTPFLLRTRQKPQGLRVTEAEEPRLFSFLHRLADEVGAPRPRNLYVSSRVNAAVLYDLSLWNLLLPLKRDLEIGLGLVNALSLAELKAVVAHEFGHFTQGSLLLGRYVYVSAQIANRLVNRRDALDKLLNRLTRTIVFTPLWIPVLAVAWALRLMLWAIRTAMESLSRLLLISHRALSLQMELQADLVAVSVTGSEPLIQSLCRLQAADEAWRHACAFAQAELSKGRKVPDLFDLQQTAIERVATLLGLPRSSDRPVANGANPATFRLFTPRFSRPPQMWAMHPANFEREENCKRRYIPSRYEDTSAWTLFDDPQSLRQRLTSEVLKTNRSTTPVSSAEARQTFEQTFERPSLRPQVRGAYLGRSIARMADQAQDLYAADVSEVALEAGFASLYPSSLTEAADRHRALVEEVAGLKALETGAVEPADGVMRFRGRPIRRGDLPAAQAEVQNELQHVAAHLSDHDRLCRTVHRAAAAALGNGWSDYLVGVVSVLHYAEHSEANVGDARGYFSYVLSNLMRHGNIDRRHVPTLLAAADTLHAALAEAFAQNPSLTLDRLIAQRAGWPYWPLRNFRFDLPAPGPGNMAAWIPAAERCANLVLASFAQLRTAALDQLIATEALVADAWRNRQVLNPAPPPSAVPTDFRRRPPGSERPREVSSDWLERWQRAQGFVPDALRAVAAGLIIAVLSLAMIAVGNHADPKAEFQTGQLILKSAKTPAQYALAAKWFAAAAAQHLPAAENNLGVLYYNGRGVPQNLTRGVALFRRAASDGNPQAEANLGFAYLTGRGAKRNYSNAQGWLRKAADGGVVSADVGMGYIYQQGLGVAADPAQAIKYFSIAAAASDPNAEEALGEDYLNGTGVSNDAVKAASWFRKAAQQGVASAEYNLAMLYFRGEGVQADRRTAMRWLWKAAAQGFAPAIEAVKVQGTTPDLPANGHLQIELPVTPKPPFGG